MLVDLKRYTRRIKFHTGNQIWTKFCVVNLKEGSKPCI